MTNALSTGAQPGGTAEAFHALTHQQTAGIVVAGIAALALLWLRARWHQGRLSRSYSRAMRRAGIGRQLRGMHRNRVMAKASATRRATLAFRKAAGVALVVFALWLHSRGHV